MSVKSKQKRLIVILSGILFFVIISAFIMFNTNIGKKMAIGFVSDRIYDNMNYEQSSKLDLRTQETLNPVKYSKDQKIFNIALIGSQDGNTDTMIIATLNTVDKSLTLTSLLRDIYVDIPGHQSAKLNSTFHLGGADLFYNTIKQNFGLTLDGYLLVDYKAFEYIIDRIDGVEVTLTKEEANYLNTTNYISKKENRNVSVGTQILNGNQALGYSRIRKKPTGENEHDDFGRTSRQRVILQQVYKNVKGRNLVSIVGIMNDVMKNANIKTDITKEEFSFYLSKAVDLKMDAPKTHRIPSNGTYLNESRKIGKRDLSVLVIKDWEETKKELNNIVFGSLPYKN